MQTHMQARNFIQIGPDKKQKKHLTRHGNKANRKSDSLLYHLSNKYVLQIKGNQQTQTICRKNQKPKSKKYKQIVKHINYTNKYVKQPQIQNPNGGNNSQTESPKSKIFYQMESK
jgi:hypothetical protein